MTWGEELGPRYGYTAQGHYSFIGKLSYRRSTTLPGPVYEATVAMVVDIVVVASDKYLSQALSSFISYLNSFLGGTLDPGCTTIAFKLRLINRALGAVQPRARAPILLP